MRAFFGGAPAAGTMTPNNSKRLVIPIFAVLVATMFAFLSFIPATGNSADGTVVAVKSTNAEQVRS